MAKSKLATLIQVGKNAVATQKHYKLAPPLDGHQYVIVSAANVPMSGPETYIFASNKAGEIVDWLELEGSFKGDLNHEKALKNAGYKVDK